MESLVQLFFVCGIIFVLFSLNEVVKLKKTVNRLDGIVKYLIKLDKEKNENK